MSIIRSHVRLAVDFRASAPARVIAQWAEGLKLNAERINEKRQTMIPNEETYQSKLAKPSTDKFAPFVNPSFTSEAGLDSGDIINKQGANVRDSYIDYKEALDWVFATVDGVSAKRYKELVDLAREEFSRGTAKRSLPFTGIKIEELGPAPIASCWLVGDQLVVGKLRNADKVLEGGPFLVTKTKKRAALKAALTQRLIQAGAAIIRANFSPAVITAQNNLTNELVQGFIDPALGLDSFTTGGASRIDYVMDKDDLWLEVQVSQV
ncbi:MAG: hypothetical protein HY811_07685 [Planctomycetes bacterium]|nr:hypothetical protein [Planctomycetota bacterium]